jgi:hypothetical protein
MPSRRIWRGCGMLGKHQPRRSELTEPFSSCDLAGRKDVGGLGELAGLSGVAVEFVRDVPGLGLGRSPCLLELGVSAPDPATRAGQWRAAYGQNRTPASIWSREVSRSCRGWAPSARRPATASTFRCTWCPARLLSRMAGQVPGADCVQRADCVQGAAGEQVVAWLPGVGGDAGGERWRRWPGGVRGELLAGTPGPSQ